MDIEKNVQLIRDSRGIRNVTWRDAQDESWSDARPQGFVDRTISRINLVIRWIATVGVALVGGGMVGICSLIGAGVIYVIMLLSGVSEKDCMPVLIGIPTAGFVIGSIVIGYIERPQ